MSDASGPAIPITPREKLDFDLDRGIARYWCAGDPFKTRFFDALSVQFPEGERFFITSVREFRDGVQDPQLKADIAAFIRQEGQHGMVHDRYNALLAAQGVRVDRIEATQRRIYEWLRRWCSARFNLALTAASEHMTAIMAHSFFERQSVFAGADQRIRALYAWHAMEEVEHKAVAFDVMRRVARCGYVLRIAAMIVNTVSFPIDTFLIMHHMFRVDGLPLGQRLRLWLRGLWWLYKPGGVFMPVLGHYLRYYRPGFHPQQAGNTRVYDIWTGDFAQHRDPVHAGNTVFASARNDTPPRYQ